MFKQGFTDLVNIFKQARAQDVSLWEKIIRRISLKNKVKIFFSTANEELGEKICKKLQIKRGQAVIDFWANGEVKIQLLESVKGCYCFVLGSYHENSNIRHMEIKAIIRACQESGAEKIITVIPFLGYGKQERIKQGREAIMAKLVAKEICAAGTDQVVVIDLHAEAIQGFFDVPVDHLKSLKYIIDAVKKDADFQAHKAVGVSPDAGGVARARKFINTLGCYLAIIFKYRPTPESADTTVFLGEIKGKVAYMLDDMIQSAVTMVESVIKLIEKGAKKIILCVTHGDWCGKAIENMRLLLLSGALDRLYITDTTPLPQTIKELPNVKIISMAPMLAEAIKRIYLREPLSSLYEVDSLEEKKPKEPLSLAERLAAVLKKHRNIDIDLGKIDN